MHDETCRISTEDNHVISVIRFEQHAHAHARRDAIGRRNRPFPEPTTTTVTLYSCTHCGRTNHHHSQPVYVAARAKLAPASRRPIDSTRTGSVRREPLCKREWTCTDNDDDDGDGGVTRGFCVCVVCTMYADIANAAHAKIYTNDSYADVIVLLR